MSKKQISFYENILGKPRFVGEIRKVIRTSVPSRFVKNTNDLCTVKRMFYLKSNSLGEWIELRESEVKELRSKDDEN